ncbi:hypothetical protein HYS29_02200 [Candidatus Microgenomates bacterium]|nr:hypothetical protein [Candidatus Microgenomates bacterium]
MSKAESLPRYPEHKKPQEACGIAAILSKKGLPIAEKLAGMQGRLQHRGQDSTGLSTWDGLPGKIKTHKDLGRVTEVFPPGFDFELAGLSGDRGIGHNRYGTSGEATKDDISGAQPMVVEWNGRKIAIAYNGNLPESEREKLRRRIPSDLNGSPNFDTADIARAIVSAPGYSWEEKIRNGLDGVSMAYALTILTDTGEVFGLRGPTGHWPLWVGENDDLIVFASETRVDESSKLKWREVMPGELVKAIFFGVKSKNIFPPERLSRCSLHDMYGAKPDSIMTLRNGESVTYEEFRKYAGGVLAREHPIKADLYLGIPNTGLPIAEGYAKELGEEATPGIIIKRGDLRAFIGRDEKEIRDIVNRNLAIEAENVRRLRARTVVTVDDSLIRGKSAGGDPLNGSEEEHPIKRAKGYNCLLREAGAVAVHNLFALPKFVEGCDMGYYIRKGQLVALVRRDDGIYEVLNEEAIATRIGADSVHFLSPKGVQEAYEWVFGKSDVACMHCMGQPHPLDIVLKEVPIFSCPSLATS